VLRSGAAVLSPSPKALREDTAAELAEVSGAKDVRFQNENDLERELSILADDIHNSYTLSFRPSSLEPRFHSITVQVVNQRANLEVMARTSY
jgi:hypothetical protein